MKKGFYSCEEIAELMGIKISTIRTYCKEGKIPSVKIGRSYRISAKDFEEWCEDSKQVPPDAKIKKYLRRLKESETKYRILTDQSLDGIVMTDFKGTLVLVNPSFCQMLDYSEEELLGTNLTQYFHPDERARAVEGHMRRTAGEVDAQPQRVRLLKKDGKTVFVEILGSPAWEGGKIIGVQKIIRDITGRKRLEQELETILELLPSAFVINDFKGKAYRANSRVLELTGYTREEILAMESLVNLYWYPEDRAESMRLLRENGEFYNREFTARLKGNRKMEVAMHAKVIKIGGETYIASLCQDNTKRKQMQKELNEARKVLETTFNALNFGILHLDTDFNVLFTNAWLKKRFPGIVAGEICRMPSVEGKELCPWCPAAKCFKSGKPEKAEATIESPDGKELRLRFAAYPVKDSKSDMKHVTETIVDLSEKQKPGWDVLSP